MRRDSIEDSRLLRSTASALCHSAGPKTTDTSSPCPRPRRSPGLGSIRALRLPCLSSFHDRQSSRLRLDDFAANLAGTVCALQSIAETATLEGMCCWCNRCANRHVDVVTDRDNYLCSQGAGPFVTEKRRITQSLPDNDFSPAIL